MALTWLYMIQTKSNTFYTSTLPGSAWEAQLEGIVNENRELYSFEGHPVLPGECLTIIFTLYLTTHCTSLCPRSKALGSEDLCVFNPVSPQHLTQWVWPVNVGGLSDYSNSEGVVTDLSKASSCTSCHEYHPKHKQRKRCFVKGVLFFLKLHIQTFSDHLWFYGNISTWFENKF